MIDLGTLGGDRSEASAINNAGEIVGDSRLNGTFNVHAFADKAGNMSDIGPDGGSGIASMALGINRNGLIVGERNGRATIFHGTSFTDLGVIGGLFSYATHANDRGEIVGATQTARDSFYHAFIYCHGRMKDLGSLSANGDSVAVDINNRQVAVGTSSTADNKTHHAVAFFDGRIRDLGTLGGDLSSAMAINESEKIVGSSTTKHGRTHAFLYFHGVLTDLARTPEALRMGFELNEASGINEAGQIVGTGTIRGQRHAFLMTPTSTHEGYLRSPFGSVK
jgi:probable HAF family extracellular repeat protein